MAKTHTSREGRRTTPVSIRASKLRITRQRKEKKMREWHGEINFTLYRVKGGGEAGGNGFDPGEKTIHD